MLCLLAAVVLTGSEPSAAALAGRFVQVQAAIPGQQPTYEGWTVEQLEAEQRRLEDARPSVAVPIMVVVLGGVIGVGDLFVFFFGGLVVTLAGTRFDTPTIVGMTVFGVGAAALLVGGILFLRATLGDRTEYNRQLGLIREALERFAPSTPAPPIDRPPPAQFPQQVQLTPRTVVPWFAVTLARF